MAGKKNWFTLWLVVWNMTFIFPFSWECHHPNWRSPIFQRGRRKTTNHAVISFRDDLRGVRMEFPSELDKPDLVNLDVTVCEQSSFFLGQLTISMGNFNSKLLSYKLVSLIQWLIWFFSCGLPHFTKLQVAQQHYFGSQGPCVWAANGENADVPNGGDGL